MRTTVHSIMSRPNLVFSSKGSVSVMCSKFQVISMHYGQLPNHQRYHTWSPWRLYSWILGYCVIALICVDGNPKYVFFLNGDWVGDFCKVSRDFVQICKVSKIQANKRKGKNVRSIGQLWKPQCTLSWENQTYFSHQKGVFRWCVKSFKWFRCIMVSCQITKDTTHEAPEGYIAEI